MAAHLRREEVRKAWALPHGAAALPCGALFSAVRMPDRLVHAAVRTDEPAQVSAVLARMLDGGPVIRDPQGRRYYALVPASTARRWDASFSTPPSVPHPGVHISPSQTYQQKRSLHDAVTRVETKLDPLHASYTETTKDLADHETRLRALKRARRPLPTIDALAGLIGADTGALALIH